MKKTFKIHQIDDRKKNARYYMYSSLELLEEMGLKLSKDLYQEVWSEEIDVNPSDSLDYLFDKIYERFNLFAPKNFYGHSLSVSDIIEYDGHYYYCDDYGWEEVEL